VTILAADLGGTHTRVVIADADGLVLGRGAARAGNPVRVGVEQASRNLRVAASDALDAAGRAEVTAAALGMAGFSHPRAGAVVSMAMESLCLRPRVRLLTDDRSVAMRAAFDAPPGLLIMAGTGSGALAWGEAGQVARGGAGPDVGDPGSGHAIGMAALRGLLTGAGSWASSDLGVRFLDALASAGVSPDASMTWTSSEVERLWRTDGVDPSILCPLVLEAAEEGDLLALRIIAEEGDGLTTLAVDAAAAAALPRGAPVATVGSVLSEGPLRDRVLAAVCAESVGLCPGPHVADPVRGAVALAVEALAAGGTVPPGW